MSQKINVKQTAHFFVIFMKVCAKHLLFICFFAQMYYTSKFYNAFTRISLKRALQMKHSAHPHGSLLFHTILPLPFPLKSATVQRFHPQFPRILSYYQMYYRWSPCSTVSLPILPLKQLTM